ncbi:MAG: hypothetical protein ACHQ51_01060 [Elusimicrobiota bacterium]
MRHPSLILAATLLLPNGAYAIVPPRPASSPAPAAGTVPFNPQEWKVLSGADAAQAAGCPGGFLASKLSEVTAESHSWGTRFGYNTKIPVYCVKLDVSSGKAAITPVDPKIAELTVYGPGTMTPTFVVNRGKNGKDVSLRAPSDAELKPAVSADGRFAALGADERYWLEKTELAYYDKTAGENPSADARLTLESQTRHAVAKHLPSFAQAQYEALAKAPLDPKKISAYLDALIAIRDADELKKLGAIKKGAGVGAHLQRDNALEEYKGAMATVRLGADGRPLPGPNRDHAVEKVAEFRGMLAGRVGGAKPRTGPAGADDRSKVVLKLSPAEEDWLTPIQRTAYDARSKVVVKESKAARIELYKTTRDNVEKNLRPEGLPQYQEARKKMDPVAISAAILAVKHYSGAEIQLAPAEVDALAAITKAKVQTLQLGDAKVDYKREMAHIMIVNGEASRPSEHLVAYEIATRYRKMLADAGIKVPGAPDVGTVPGAKPGDKPTDTSPPETGKAPLTDDQIKKLTPDEKTAYLKEVADAKGDPAKLAAVYEKYRKILAIRDNDTFTTLSPTQQKDVCAPYKNAVINGGGASVATAACAPEEKAQKVLACAKDKDCISRVAAECDPSAAKKSNAPAASLPPITDPAVKAACASLNAQPDDTPPPDSGKKPAVVGDVPAASCGGKTTANPGSTAGTDKECGAADKKPDPNLYRNIANGMAFGMFGLILGSFFGGPLVMLAGAAIIGGAAYAASKYLNTPKKKDGA